MTDRSSKLGPTSKYLIGCVAGAILAVVAIVAIGFAVGPEPQPVKPVTEVQRPDAWQTALKSVSAVRTAESDGPLIRVYADISEQAAEEYYVSALGRVALEIGKGIKSGEIRLPASANKLKLAGFVTLIDRYGNKSAGEFLELSFPLSEFAKVNFDNMEAYGLINLADVGVPTSTGHKLVDAYCADEETGNWSQEFCGKAADQ